MIIFRDRHTLHHNIYISNFFNMITNIIIIIIENHLHLVFFPLESVPQPPSCVPLSLLQRFPASSLHCLTLTQFIILCHDFYLACYGYTSLKCSGFHFWILNFGLVIALCLFGVARFLFQSLRYFSDFGFWVSGFDLSGVDRSESMAPLSALRQTGQPAPGTIPTIPTMPRCKLSSSTSPSS